jgi:hypothetical protein
MGLRAVAVGVTSLLLAACARSAPVNVPTVVFIDGVSGGGIPASPSPADEGGSWKPREEVEVEWHGSWWPAVVLDQRGSRWLVHYEGYGSDWDEVVGPDRIRERRADVGPNEPDEPEDEPDP